LDKELEDALYSFKKGRNSVVHQFGRQDKKLGIPKSELNKQFKLGLEAYEKIWKIYNDWTSFKIKFNGKNIA